MPTQTETNQEPHMILIYPDCSECAGKGTVIREVRVSTMNSGGFADIPVTCPRCNGDGSVEVSVCSVCRTPEGDDCECYEKYLAELMRMTESILPSVEEMKREVAA